MRRSSVGILVASSVVLTILLAACGTATPPVKPLSQAAATQVASTGMVGDQLVASMIAPNGFSPLSVGAQALGVAGIQPQASCTTTSPASPVDADGDGWYASATVTYDCSYSGGGVTTTITGSVTEQDKNDGDPYSGTKATVKDLKIAVSDSSGTSSITENLSWNLTKNAPGAYALSYDFRLDVTDPSSGNASFEVQGTPTYTADSGTSNPFDAGTFTFDGKVTFQDSDGTYELTRKSSGGVHYSSTCGGFDSGTVNYHDNSNNTMTITYTGCNTISLTYNGSTVY